MKKQLSLLLICSLFFLFLTHPSEVFSGASEGLLLWFHTVLPTLFPFFVITSLLIETNSFSILSRLCSSIFCRLFSVSSVSVIAILGGFSCGYPMGAKIAYDLWCNGLISENEMRYLLSFCNNASPMFILSFLVTQKLGISKLMLPSITILFLSPIICSFFFRKLNLQHGEISRKENLSNAGRSVNVLNAFDHAISSGIETILKIGGYIIFFSILIVLGMKYLNLHPVMNLLLLPALEITQGLTMLSESSLFFWQKYVLMMFHTSFGGVCAIFQTKCVMKDTPFSFSIYTLEKLVTALVTSLLSFLYIRLLS